MNKLKPVDKDKATNWIGILMAILTAAQIDPAKLAEGDVASIIKVAMVGGWLVFGYLTNKL